MADRRVLRDEDLAFVEDLTNRVFAGEIDPQSEDATLALKLLDGHVAATRGTAPPQRISAPFSDEVKWDQRPDGGFRATRQAASGDQYVSEPLIGLVAPGQWDALSAQIDADTEQMHPVARALARGMARGSAGALYGLDWLTNLEHNETRRQRLADQYGEAAAVPREAAASVLDTGYALADNFAYNTLDNVVDGVGYVGGLLGFDEFEAARKREAEGLREITDAKTTGGGLSGLAAMSGYLAPVGLTARGIEKGAKALGSVAPVVSPVVQALGGQSIGANAARGALAAAATMQAGNLGYTDGDMDQMRYINRTPSGDVLAMLGLDTAGAGPQLQYAIPGLGAAATAAAPLARAAGEAAALARNPDRYALRRVADALDADGVVLERPRPGESFSADADVAAAVERDAASSVAADPQTVAGLGDRAPGMRLSDTGDRTRRLAASAARLGGDGADELVAFHTERTAKRPSAVVDALADAVALKKPTSADTVITDTMAMADDLIATRADLAAERGYSRMDGLQVSDERMPRTPELAAQDAPPGHTYGHEAARLLEEGEQLGLARAAREMEIADGSARKTVAIPSEENIAAMSDADVRRLLRLRGFAVSKLYEGDLPAAEAKAAGVAGQGVQLDAAGRKALLRRIAARERAGNGAPLPVTASDGSPLPPDTVRLLRGMKTAANDKAEAARMAGERARARAFTALADRLRAVLGEGVRDASGRRASLIGDRYHAVLSQAIEALEFGSGIDARTGAKVPGGSMFARTPEEVLRFRQRLDAAREAIAKDTSLAPKVRANVLAEFDRAYDALKLGAVRGFADKVQGSDTARDPGVLNAHKAALRERLSAVIDTPEERDRLLSWLDDFRRMQDTDRRILAGSKTAENLADDADMAAAARSSALDMLLSGRFADLWRAFLQPFLGDLSERYLRGMTERRADAIARIMLRTDFEVLAAELAAARRERRAPSVAQLTAEQRRVLAEWQDAIDDEQRGGRGDASFSADDAGARRSAFLRAPEQDDIVWDAPPINDRMPGRELTEFERMPARASAELGLTDEDLLPIEPRGVPPRKPTRLPPGYDVVVEATPDNKGEMRVTIAKDGDVVASMQLIEKPGRPGSWFPIVVNEDRRLHRAGMSHAIYDEVERALAARGQELIPDESLFTDGLKAAMRRDPESVRWHLGYRIEQIRAALERKSGQRVTVANKRLDDPRERYFGSRGQSVDAKDGFVVFQVGDEQVKIAFSDPIISGRPAFDDVFPPRDGEPSRDWPLDRSISKLGGIDENGRPILEQRIVTGRSKRRPGPDDDVSFSADSDPKGDMRRNTGERLDGQEMGPAKDGERETFEEARAVRSERRLQLDEPYTVRIGEDERISLDEADLLGPEPPAFLRSVPVAELEVPELMLLDDEFRAFMEGVYESERLQLSATTQKGEPTAASKTAQRRLASAQTVEETAANIAGDAQQRRFAAEAEFDHVSRELKRLVDAGLGGTKEAVRYRKRLPGAKRRLEAARLRELSGPGKLPAPLGGSTMSAAKVSMLHEVKQARLRVAGERLRRSIEEQQRAAGNASRDAARGELNDPRRLGLRDIDRPEADFRDDMALRDFRGRVATVERMLDRPIRDAAEADDFAREVASLIYEREALIMQLGAERADEIMPAVDVELALQRLNIEARDFDGLDKIFFEANAAYRDTQAFLARADEGERVARSAARRRLGDARDPNGSGAEGVRADVVSAASVAEIERRARARQQLAPTAKIRAMVEATPEGGFRVRLVDGAWDKPDLVEELADIALRIELFPGGMRKAMVRAAKRWREKRLREGERDPLAGYERGSDREKELVSKWIAALDDDSTPGRALQERLVGKLRALDESLMFADDEVVRAAMETLDDGELAENLARAFHGGGFARRAEALIAADMAAARDGKPGLIMRRAARSDHTRERVRNEIRAAGGDMRMVAEIEALLRAGRFEEAERVFARAMSRSPLDGKGRRVVKDSTERAQEWRGQALDDRAWLKWRAIMLAGAVVGGSVAARQDR